MYSEKPATISFKSGEVAYAPATTACLITSVNVYTNLSLCITINRLRVKTRAANHDSQLIVEQVFNC